MQKYNICIDLGGTTCKFGLFNSNGNLEKKWFISSQSNKNLLYNIISSIKQFLDTNNYDLNDLNGIGVGFPGMVKDNIVYNAVNVNIKFPFNIEKFFKSYLKDSIKFVCDNDTNLAAYGEYKYGNDVSVDPFCFLIVGTGLGLGIIIDSKILRGNFGLAGEFGHLHLCNDIRIQCNCGSFGCLETVSSGSGISNLYFIMSNKKIKKDTKEIFDEAKQNNMFAIKVITKSMQYLSDGIEIISKIINPKIIVIGGGVSNSGEIFIDLLNKSLDVKDKDIFFKRPIIKLAKLKNDAGLYGAYALLNDN